MNKLLDELISDELKRTGGNISKVARRLDLDYFELKTRLGQTESPTYPREDEPSDIRTLGKAPHTSHVIAIKHSDGVWPSKYDDVIQDARRKFDAGTHEMCSSRIRGWTVLYCIPRKEPTPPRFFFSNLEFAV